MCYTLIVIRKYCQCTGLFRIIKLWANWPKQVVRWNTWCKQILAAYKQWGDTNKVFWGLWMPISGLQKEEGPFKTFFTIFVYNWTFQGLHSENWGWLQLQETVMPLKQIKFPPPSHQYHCVPLKLNNT